MQKHKWKSVEGYCPIQEDDVEIGIKYIEVSAIGSPTRYRKIRLDCRFGNDGQCPLENAHARDTEKPGCPIYMKAPFYY